MKLDKPLHAAVASAFFTLILLNCGGGDGVGGGTASPSTGGSTSGIGGGPTVGTGGGLSGGTGGASAIGVGGGTDLLFPDGSAGSRDLEVCDDVNFEITGRVVDMLIALDRSESMTESRLWNPMGAALTNVTAATDSGVDFGLLTFPFTDEQCAPGDILLGITDPNAAAIADLVGGGVNDVGTAFGTPTAASLRVAKTYLDTVVDGRAKFVLLATDGAPNCNAALDSSTCTCSIDTGGGMNVGCTTPWCLDNADSAAAAAELYAAGYPVYVLGIGDSMKWESVMNEIALAGGTERYLSAESDEFEAKLTEIVGGVMSCDFDVDWATLADGAEADPALVNLYCKQSTDEPNNDDATTGNAILLNDGCNSGGAGWTWPPDGTYTAISLCPDTCNSIKNGGCPVISATFGCESIAVE